MYCMFQGSWSEQCFARPKQNHYVLFEAPSKANISRLCPLPFMRNAAFPAKCSRSAGVTWRQVTIVNVWSFVAQEFCKSKWIVPEQCDFFQRHEKYPSNLSGSSSVCFFCHSGFFFFFVGLGGSKIPIHVSLKNFVDLSFFFFSTPFEGCKAKYGIKSANFPPTRLLFCCQRVWLEPKLEFDVQRFLHGKINWKRWFCWKVIFLRSGVKKETVLVPLWQK